MLNKLYIKDFAIIDSLELDFDDGFLQYQVKQVAVNL